MRDTKVMRGADFGTDHEMLLTNVGLKFRQVERQQDETKRCDLEKLKSEAVRQEPEIRFGGRFAVLMEEMRDASSEELWTKGKEIRHEAAGEVLGKWKLIKQPWMTQEVLDRCNERREAKRTINSNPTEHNIMRYPQVCRQVESTCKLAKAEWLNSKCKQCEDSHRDGNSKVLFKTVKEIMRDFRHQSMVVKNERGEKVSGEANMKTVWKQHFEKLYRRQDEEHLMDNYPELQCEKGNLENTPPILESEGVCVKMEDQ